MQPERVAVRLKDRFLTSLRCWTEAGADALAFIDFPGSHWKQV